MIIYTFSQLKFCVHLKFVFFTWLGCRVGSELAVWGGDTGTNSSRRGRYRYRTVRSYHQDRGKYGPHPTRMCAHKSHMVSLYCRKHQIYHCELPLFGRMLSFHLSYSLGPIWNDHVDIEIDIDNTQQHTTTDKNTQQQTTTHNNSTQQHSGT